MATRPERVVAADTDVLVCAPIPIRHPLHTIRSKRAGRRLVHESTRMCGNPGSPPHGYGPTYAQASISTWAPTGSPATAKAERAGRWSPKAATYASFMAA
jgi:hypothetical protein